MIFIDDLLITGLALESIYLENVENVENIENIENVEKDKNVENIKNIKNLKSPSKIVELFDWSFTFLTMHTDETSRLLNPNIGYFSPMLLVAFNLQPEQVFQLL